MKFVHAELTSKELITQYLGVFKFRTEENIPFLPGQYLTLGVRREGLQGKAVRVKDGKGMVLRPMSVASSPEEEEIEFYIAWVLSDGRRDDGYGVLSTEVFNPPPNIEYLLSDRAKGKFLLPDDTRDVVMVATGSGLAPYTSILRLLNKKGSNRRFIVIHGVARHSDLAYKDEVKGYSNLNITYLHTTSREECDEIEKRYAEEFFMNRSGKTGRLSVEEVKEGISNGKIKDTGIEEVLGKELTPQNCVIMLCGNPGMIDHIREIALAKQFERKKDFITEEYW